MSWHRKPDKDCQIRASPNSICDAKIWQKFFSGLSRLCELWKLPGLISDEFFIANVIFSLFVAAALQHIQLVSGLLAFATYVGEEDFNLTSSIDETNRK